MFYIHLDYKALPYMGNTSRGIHGQRSPVPIKCTRRVGAVREGQSVLDLSEAQGEVFLIISCQQ